MNSEHAPARQDDAAFDDTVHTGENAPLEVAGEHRRKGASPFSLVPALTLISLQFMKDEPGPFDFFIQSIGGGGHRPDPE